MLQANCDAIVARLDERAVVLDVGAGARPFERADWVIDLMPYGERGLYGPLPDPESERFGEETWVLRDICDREPWPFTDDQFDFAICSHTLEDVRDPIWVCSELVRVAKAGYIEVPSRLEEQSYGWQGPWTGWSHHRWLIDIDGDAVDFVFKPAMVHGRESDRFPPGVRWELSERERVQWLFWEGSFRFRERLLSSPEEADAYLQGFIAAHPPSPSVMSRAERVRRAASAARERRAGGRSG